MEARSSGDPAAIGQASAKVIALALAEMAKLRLDDKAYEEAIKLCGESLKFEDTAETRVEIAIASLYAKKLPEAVRQASSATELDPQNTLAWTIKGEALLRTKSYAEAVSALRQAIELKSDAEALYALGVAQLGLGDKEAAAERFSQFLNLVGDYGWSRVLIGRAYQGQLQLSEAETEFRTAVRLDPRTPNAHYFWALILLKENEWSPTPEVFSHLQNELRLNPRHFEANYMLGSLASHARNYKESDQYLLLASEVKPSVPETWVLLGLNAQNHRTNRVAESYFRKAIELAKDLDFKEHLEVRKAYIGLGRILVSSGRTREGEELLNKARELQAQSLAERQKSLTTENGRQDERETMGGATPYLPETDSDHRPYLSPPSALGSITKEGPSSSTRAAGSSSSDPDGKIARHLGAVLGSSFNDLATAEALQQKYDLAAKHYREAAKWDAQIPGLQRNQGLAAYFVGDHAEAIRLLAKVVREAPDDAYARAVLGLAYFATQKFAMAMQTISPIAERAAQDPQLGLAWATSLAKTGNKIGAVRALERLEHANPSMSVENLIQSGRLWMDLGKTERAAEFFRRALVIDPENADAKCALGLSKCP
jgi:tetratricopeptide (TPR) repeat protein